MASRFPTKSMDRMMKYNIAASSGYSEEELKRIGDQIVEALEEEGHPDEYVERIKKNYGT